MFEPLDESERINDRALDSQSVREYRESPERSTFSDIRENERSHEPASRQTGPGPVQVGADSVLVTDMIDTPCRFGRLLDRSS